MRRYTADPHRPAKATFYQHPSTNIQWCPGIYQLMVSAVGFGLIKRELEFLTDEPRQLEIYLSPGTAIVDKMTVAAEIRAAPARLSATEINNLKSVLTDDSIRTIQHLPSLPVNDDFNTGFAMQGSGFDRLGILFDGIPAQFSPHDTGGKGHWVNYPSQRRSN